MFTIMKTADYNAKVQSMEAALVEAQKQSLTCYFCGTLHSSLLDLKAHAIECTAHPLSEELRKADEQHEAMLNSAGHHAQIIASLSEEIDGLYKQVEELQEKLAPATVQSILRPGLYVARMRHQSDNKNQDAFLVATAQSKGDFKDKLQGFLSGARRSEWRILDYKMIQDAPTAMKV